MNDVVVEKELTAQTDDGQRMPIKVLLGRPYEVADNTWSCPLRMDGIGPVSDGLGTDAWNALTVAIGVARQQLDHLVARGDRLFSGDDDGELDLDDMFPRF